MSSNEVVHGVVEGSLLLLASSSSPASGQATKRKNTSFKITNILPSRPPSNDPEESGEDDPDDSHTEELSDALDSAAPAVKKLSSSLRRNSFDAAASAAAACVAAGGTKEAAVSILSSNGLPASAMSVLNEALPVVFSLNAKWVSSILSVSPCASAASASDARQGPKDRFKVVRMETKTPLKRGRWTCIDYIDKRSIPHGNQSAASAAAAAASATLNSSEKNNELTSSTLNSEGGELHQSHQPHCEEHPSSSILPPPSSVVPSSSHIQQTHHIHQFHHHHPAPPSSSAALVGVDPAASSNVVRLSSNPPTPGVVQSPSGPPLPPPSSSNSSQQQQMIQQMYQKAGGGNPTPTQQQQVIQFAAPSVGGVASNSPAVSSSTSSVTSSATLIKPPQLIPSGSTLVSSVSTSAGGQQPVHSPQILHTHQQLILDGGAGCAIPTSYITPLSFAAGLLPTSSSAVNSIPPSRAETDLLPPASSSAFYPAHFDHPIDNEHLVERLEEISTQQNAPSNVDVEDVDNSCDITNSVIGGGYRPNNHSNVLTNNSSLSGGEVRPSFPSQQHQQRIVRGGGPSRLTSRAVSPSKERPSSEGAHLLASFYSSASGTNQGAIDNRIEQAMDLVKSHLMNAVRSEVEELKERIVKLEDVISHLQNENDFLKANVSQEVLTQLPPTSHAHHQILSSAATQGNTQQPGGGLSPISTPLPSGNNTQQQQQQQPL